MNESTGEKIIDPHELPLEGDHWEIPNETSIAEASNQTSDELEKRLKANSWTDFAIGDVTIGFREAFVNAMKYGKPMEGAGVVIVDLVVTPTMVQIHMHDDGAGFDWRAIADPREKEKLGETSGRGVFMMQSLYHSVEFNEAGNEVTMRRYSDHGPIDKSDDNWEKKLPAGLSGEQVDRVLEADGQMYWHLKPELLIDKKIRAEYEEERRQWP